MITLDEIKTLTLMKSKSEKEAIEIYNQEIDEAIERVKSGKFKTQEEVEALLETFDFF